MLSRRGGGAASLSDTLPVASSDSESESPQRRPGGEERRAALDRPSLGVSKRSGAVDSTQQSSSDLGEAGNVAYAAALLGSSALQPEAALRPCQMGPRLCRLARARPHRVPSGLIAELSLVRPARVRLRARPTRVGEGNAAPGRCYAFSSFVGRSSAATRPMSPNTARTIIATA